MKMTVCTISFARFLDFRFECLTLTLLLTTEEEEPVKADPKLLKSAIASKLDGRDRKRAAESSGTSSEGAPPEKKHKSGQEQGQEAPKKEQQKKEQLQKEKKEQKPAEKPSKGPRTLAMGVKVEDLYVGTGKEAVKGRKVQRELPSR